MNHLDLVLSIAKTSLYLIFLCPAAAVQGRHIQAGCAPTEISASEAEILIYFLPASEAVRAQGYDVGWERQESQKLNQKDFYVFWVYDATRPSNGSVTVGYFSVNKHTGEVWGDSEEQFITSKSILAIQKILRRNHCINEGIIRKYTDRRPDVDADAQSKPAGNHDPAPR
ncbi:MAG: hypothetical protein ACRD4M_01085 [Candidatus Acidiferrales bacterium]